MSNENKWDKVGCGIALLLALIVVFLIVLFVRWEMNRPTACHSSRSVGVVEAMILEAGYNSAGKIHGSTAMGVGSTNSHETFSVVFKHNDGDLIISNNSQSCYSKCIGMVGKFVEIPVSEDGWAWTDGGWEPCDRYYNFDQIKLKE